MRVFLIMLSALVSSSVFADWTSIKSRAFSLSSPPAKGSREYEEDFRVLHHYQETRTREDCAIAETMKEPSFSNIFGNEKSPLSGDEYTKAKKLFEEIIEFTDRVSSYFKTEYQRVRPYNADLTLKPCIFKPSGARAYPSSHSAIGYTSACLLAKAFPRKAKGLRAYGEYVGELRAIGGVHHPSDIEAGRELGQQICDRLMQESDFKEALNKIKK